MHNSIQNIRDLFPEVSSTLTVTKEDYSLTGYIEVLPDSCLAECHIRYLYVLKDKKLLSRMHLVPHMSFLYLTEDKEDTLFPKDTDPELYSVLTLHTADGNLVTGRMQEHFNNLNGISQWADSLLSILFSEQGINGLINHAYTLFLNPIYVFDPDYRLIASTYEIDPDMDPIGLKIALGGGFAAEEFKLVNSDPKRTRALHADEPMIVQNGKNSNRMIVANIDTDKPMGHFVITEYKHPFEKPHLTMARKLQLAINQQLKKDEFTRNNRGFHYEFFLRDILDGRISIGKHYQANYSYVNNEFHGNLFCLVIETARSSRVVNTMHIRALFEITFPNAMSLMYNGAIAIVFCFEDYGYFQKKDHQKMKKICEEYGLYAGLSNCFSNIFELKEYYLQALRSIELGTCYQDEPSLYLYQNYYLDHLTNVFQQKESAEAFLHPIIRSLLAYDRDNHTELAETLYLYLICERSIAAASEALYMHRNTLVYRLKKIDSLVQIDYDNFLERQHLILSYEMAKGTLLSRQISGKEQIAMKKESQNHHTPGKTKKSSSRDKQTEKKILNALRSHPELSQKKLAVQLGIPESAVRYHMDRLQSNGKLSREGTARSGKWILHD